MSSEYRLERVRHTLEEMFLERGYRDVERTETGRVMAKKEGDIIVCGFTTLIVKLNVSEIHNIIGVMQKENLKHGIIVFEGMPTPAVKNVMMNIAELGLNIELFCADDLQFNITLHRLVPRHIRMGKEESKEFKQKYGTDIPVLMRSDPVARFYDFQKGEVVKVVRKNGFVSYRIVR